MKILKGLRHPRGYRLSDGSSPERFSHSRSHHNSDHKPFSLFGWFNLVKNRKSPSPTSSSNVTRGERIEQSDLVNTSELDVAFEAVTHDSSSGNSRDPDIEEYQIQLALELSAREDPEAVQIEAVKQISLGSCPSENTPAEVVAYRYWVSLFLTRLAWLSLVDLMPYARLSKSL